MTSSQTTSQFDIDKVQLGDIQDVSSGFNSFKNQRDNDKLFEGGSKEGSATEHEECYKDLVRHVGQGPVRLDTEIDLQSDIYSMLFVSCFKADLVRFYDREGEVENKEEKNENPFQNQEVSKVIDAINDGVVLGTH